MNMDNISVALSVQAWNNILAVLGDRPFKEVADLISEIKRQAEAQIVPAAPAVDEPVAEAA
jgi:hypothetical protein